MIRSREKRNRRSSTRNTSSARAIVAMNRCESLVRTLARQAARELFARELAHATSRIDLR